MEQRCLYKYTFNSYYRHFIYTCILLCGTILKSAVFIMCKSTKKKHTKVIKSCKLIRTFSFVWKTRKNTLTCINHAVYKQRKSLYKLQGSRKQKHFVQTSRREASQSQHFRNKTSVKRETKYKHENNRWGSQEDSDWLNWEMMVEQPISREEGQSQTLEENKESLMKLLRHV